MIETSEFNISEFNITESNKWFTYQTIKYKSQGINLPELEQFKTNSTTLNKNKNKNKFAFFDLDGTLITRPNGKSPIYHETDPNNWIFLGPVLQILNAYNESGYQIIIISNQSNFNEAVEEKINQISLNFKKKCNFEPIFICAVGSTKKKSTNDNFRKPNIGIIEWIRSLMHIIDPNINFIQILNQSLMCGDAVGKSNTESIEYQWSDVDYKFAENAGIQFIEPKTMFGSNINSSIPETKQAQLYILVGNQGSGKSTWGRKISSSPCSMDELKTIKHMEKNALHNVVSNNMPIVIDSTNSSKDKRKHWIDWAKTNDLTYTIVWILRDGRPFNAMRTQDKVPEIAYNIYSKYFEKPLKTEGNIYLVY